MAWDGKPRSGKVVARFLIFCIFLGTAWAQQLQSVQEDRTAFKDPSVTYQTLPGTGVLLLNVFAESSRKPLDRQALLHLADLANHTSTWQTTSDTSKAVFANLPYGSYDVEASAVGYLSVHKVLQVTNSLGPISTDIVLSRDPAAINLDVVDRELPAKARKETKRAVSALKSGKFKEAQKQLDEAIQLAPSSSELNFLLGYLYFQKTDFGKASSYLATATTENPRDAQALTLLGRVRLEQHDYGAAGSALEQAIAANAEGWLPHNLLADAYLHQQKYGKARDEAQAAITRGKSEAGASRVVLGEALLGLGLAPQAIEELNTFLQELPRDPLADQVRKLVAEIRENDLASAAPDNERASVSDVDPLRALAAPGLSVKSWQPPGIDQTQVALAPGAICPMEQVVEESGKHVQELVADLESFAAVEDLFHESLDEFGNPTRSETRKYNYVASISEPQPGFLAVEEFRADKSDLGGYPDQIASSGFAALALVFHPHIRDNFDMKCEGLADWHGQASWLVEFRQRQDKPNRIHAYKVGKQIYPVSLKGRAWISADTFEILRIESEMVHPMPEIRLLSEHAVVEYGAIRFEKKNTSLWLPKTADIYFDFRQHRYYRRHSFDHYMLFSVDSTEKRKEPAGKPGDKAVRPPEKKS